MLVAIVTEPFSPALAMISASRSLFFAFNTSCGIFFFFNIWLINSEVSTAIVPTRTGCPFACLFSTSSTNASNLAFLVPYTASG